MGERRAGSSGARGLLCARECQIVKDPLAPVGSKPRRRLVAVIPQGEHTMDSDKIKRKLNGF